MKNIIYQNIENFLAAICFSIIFLCLPILADASSDYTCRTSLINADCTKPLDPYIWPIGETVKVVGNCSLCVSQLCMGPVSDPPPSGFILRGPGGVSTTVATATGTYCEANNSNIYEFTNFTLTAGSYFVSVVTETSNFSFITDPGTSFTVTDIPVVLPVSAYVQMDTSVNWTPKTIAPDQRALNCRIAQAPTNGTATIASDCSTGTYTPSPAYVGTDSFTYIASVGGVDSLPGAVAISVGVGPCPANQGKASISDHIFAGTGSDIPVTFAMPNVSAGDYPATCIVKTPPANGTASIQADCSAGTYTPNAGYSGVEQFEVVAKNLCGESAPRIASISVIPDCIDNNCGILQRYKLQEIDALPGYGIFRSTAYDAVDLNDNGQIVGEFFAQPYTGITSNSSFVWDRVNGVKEIIAPVGARFFTPNGINLKGQISGFATNTVSRITEAFILETDATFTSLGFLPGDTDSYGEGINAVGNVVGRSTLNTARQAFMWNQATSKMVGLGYLPGKSTSKAFAINDNNQVAGISGLSYIDGAEAFIWSEGSGMVGLGHLPGGGSGSLNDHISINNIGQVAGNSDATGATNTQAFFWSPETAMLGLGYLPGYPQSYANDINDLSQVVGFSGTNRGFIWDQQHGMIALPTLIEPQSASLISTATNIIPAAINNKGEIALTATLASDDQKTYLLSPITLCQPTAVMSSDATNWVANIDEPITLSASASDDYCNYPLTYNWDFGDNTSSTLQDPVTSYSGLPDVYDINLTATNTLQHSNTATQKMIVGPPKVNGFWPKAGDSSSIIFVFGENFNTAAGVLPSVAFGALGNQVPTALVQTLADDLLLAKPPQDDNLGPISVSTQAGTPLTSLGTATSSSIFDAAPSTALGINGLWPVTARVGNVVFIFGENFSTVPGEMTITINGVIVPVGQAVAPDLAILVVPAGVTSGPVCVSQNNTSVCSAIDLTIL